MTETTEQIPILVPRSEIVAFCQRWDIIEFALFGSVLGESFGQESDVDVLVEFASGSERSPDREAVRAELEGIFGRPVDLTYRRVIEQDPNYIIRNAILSSARVIYAA